MSCSDKIDAAVDELNLKRYSSELDYCHDWLHEETIKDDPVKVAYIKERMVRLEELQNSYVKKDVTTKNTLFEEVDKYIYKRPWNKLQSYHRSVKLTDYINNTYSAYPSKDKLLTEVIALVDKGELSSCKMVKYDAKNETVSHVPALKFSDTAFDVNTTFAIKFQ
jgi:hypothetical protein